MGHVEIRNFSFSKEIKIQAKTNWRRERLNWRDFLMRSSYFYEMKEEKMGKLAAKTSVKSVKNEIWIKKHVEYNR